jgi:hypothetical protein
MKLTGVAAGLRDGGDGVLENQLFLGTGFKQDRELIEASDSTRKFSSVEEVNDDRGLLSTNGVEKGVLNVLWCLFAV